MTKCQKENETCAYGNQCCDDLICCQDGLHPFRAARCVPPCFEEGGGTPLCPYNYSQFQHDSTWGTAQMTKVIPNSRNHKC